MSAAARRQATVIASTLRPPALSGGKRGEPVLHLSALRCMPIDPVGTQTAMRFGLQAPYTQLETFAFPGTGSSAGSEELPDVARGDVLVVGAVRYTISGIAAFDSRHGSAHLILERDNAGRA